MMPDYTWKAWRHLKLNSKRQKANSSALCPALVEPLSQRELEVLQLIAQGLSNDEISKRLFLALDTVKGHNRRIFDKLQVQRTEAAAPPPPPGGCVKTPGILFFLPPSSVKQNNTSINTKVSTQPPVLRIYCLSLSNRRILMDIYEAIYTTCAMRRLKPDPIPYDVQARILDAAIHAPHIGEGWRFILVDDPAIKSQLAALPAGI